LPRFHRLTVPGSVLALFVLAGCGNATVIGSGPSPTTAPVTPQVTYEYTVPSAAANPGTLVSGADGYLYFTEVAASKIGQLTTGGSFKELATTTASASPTGIVVGPDNHIWFTEKTANKIGTFSTFLAASMTEYTVPWTSQPAFITRGAPYNSMFFTDPGKNALGEVLVGGTFAGPFMIPRAGANPMGIVTGPDNREWFAENGASKIGAFDTGSGTFAEYALSAGSNPVDIVAGTDGALWFTENIAGAAKVGRITTGGTLTEYALAGAHSAEGLAVDLFGDLVVTDPSNNAIGVFKATGDKSYTEYPVTTASANPFWIAPGPDGKMYFTESTADKIGQFTYY
jgi:virginiamycin B lyase